MPHPGFSKLEFTWGTVSLWRRRARTISITVLSEEQMSHNLMVCSWSRHVADLAQSVQYTQAPSPDDPSHCRESFRADFTQTRLSCLRRDIDRPQNSSFIARALMERDYEEIHAG